MTGPPDKPQRVVDHDVALATTSMMVPRLSIRFVPAGRNLRVHLMQAAPGAPLRILSVDASYDGGHTWLPIILTGAGDAPTAMLPRNPGGSPVSPRARADDRTGATVDQTTINAYRAK